MAEGARALDWGAGEALAFATLLAEGTHVRLSGQDSARGTFAHRHAVLHDVEDGHHYVPLQNIAPRQARFSVWNSPLNETGVLGFDWGYSLDVPEALVVWEAQFGDFTNVAQVIVDQFISSAEQKWGRLSGLTLLLPHGFEGQGPEHSSARLERFLGLAARDNIQVIVPTTPAQIFHALRRQVRRAWRKPLVVMSPKSLLRLPAAVSSLDELASGGFQRVIPDVSGTPPPSARALLLTSGKLYYELAAARAARSLNDVHIARIEQLYPVPARELAPLLAQYPEKAPIVWVQEEPRNMGAWTFVSPEAEAVLDTLAGRSRRLRYVGRPASASPATGLLRRHVKEQATLVAAALTLES
jgi:2-oxoglutarate dehydrogenase E1 component